MYPMDWLYSLIPALAEFSFFGYWFVFLAAFLEAVIIFGSFVPGATIVVIFGFLSAEGTFNFVTLFWFAVAGAVAGDGLSFYLGRKGTRFFKDENKLLRMAHLEKAKSFFNKYGDKSIFVGRFVGIIRPMIPFTAGLCGMETGKFIFWNVFSGIVWALAHLLLGYFFGGALNAIELWLTRFGLFLFLAFVSIFLLWFFVRRGSRFWNFLKSLSRSISESLWENREVLRLRSKYPLFFEVMGHRLDRKKFSGLPLTLLCLSFLYLIFLLAGVTENIISADPVVATDIRVGNLIYSFRDPLLISVFLYVTLLGKAAIVVSGAAIISLIFWLYGKRYYIFPLWITLLGSEGFAFLGKEIIRRGRPSGALPFYLESSFSFPSGHAVIATAFYGFLAYVLLQTVKRWRYRINILFFGLLIILLVGFSRLYLGVHFLSDVTGGFFVGLLWLIVGISFSEWLFHREKREDGKNRPAKFSAVLSVFLIFSWLVFYGAVAYSYSPVPNDFKEPSERFLVKEKPEEIFSEFALPRYTEGLSGREQEPVSLVLVAKDGEALAEYLRKSGWHLSDRLGFRSLMKTAGALLKSRPYETAPMTPLFWNKRVNDFGFEKPTEKNSVAERHHARFWDSGGISEGGERIYIGTVSYDSGIKWAVTHRIAPDIDSEREILFNDLLEAGVVENFRKERFVRPLLAKNIFGDKFFTDGEVYIIYLR